MYSLSKETLALLDDIERRIDADTEEDYKNQWHDFLYDRFDGDVFMPERKVVSPPGVELPPVNINDALKDYELMLVAQMQEISRALSFKRANICVRSNYGTGIMTSLFGAEIFEMPREMNTLPTTHSFNDTDRIREAAEAGMPDLMGGFGRNVFEFGELCAEVFEKYPKIKQYVTVYHPDTQGPLDVCELLWGSEIFYSMYDEPELVHAMLSLVTETYTAFMNKWYGLFPKNDEINPHWHHMWHRGAIVLRDDSATNLSPALYEEYALPYDSELLKRFNGGCIHFCGRGDHYIEAMSNAPLLYGINMSQPELNDMETIYKHTVDKGIKILSLPESWVRENPREKKYGGNLSVF